MNGFEARAAFAHELRRLRTESGLSQAELAKRINYSKSHLCRVELGIKLASAAMARLCDRELGTAGALTRLLQPRSTKPRLTRAGVGEVWTMRLDPEGRTEFTTYAGPADHGTMTALLSWTIAPPTDPAGTAEHALPAFRTMLGQLRSLGQTTDPATISGILIPITNAIRALAASTPPELAAAAMRLASRYAEYTGWMAQEKGDDTAAQWWTNYAVNFATAGGDAELSHYALVRQADIELYRGDALATIALARRAQASPCSARTRGIAAQREAQGHALAGDETACYQALDRARLWMSEPAEITADTVLGSAMMPDPVSFVTGWCLLDLGRPMAAAEILTRQLAELPVGAQRVQARYAARLALALASAREIDQACEVATPVLSIAGAIDSATVRQDLRQLSRTMSRWPTNSSVRTIMPRLTSALHTKSAHPLVRQSSSYRRSDWPI